MVLLLRFIEPPCVDKMARDIVSLSLLDCRIEQNEDGESLTIFDNRIGGTIPIECRDKNVLKEECLKQEKLRSTMKCMIGHLKLRIDEKIYIYIYTNHSCERSLKERSSVVLTRSLSFSQHAFPIIHDLSHNAYL
jgi:hypothetical protein